MAARLGASGNLRRRDRNRPRACRRLRHGHQLREDDARRARQRGRRAEEALISTLEEAIRPRLSKRAEDGWPIKDRTMSLRPYLLSILTAASMLGCARGTPNSAKSSPHQSADLIVRNAKVTT